MRLHIFWVFLCPSLLLNAWETPRKTGQQVGFHVESSLVLIPVSVTDPKDRPVLGLDKDNFRVFDGGAEQRVLQVWREDTPVAVSLVLDASRSMAPKLAEVRAAAAALLESASPEDEYSLVEFQDQARLTQPPTNDPRDIRARLSQVTAQGHTALLDGVRLAIESVRKSGKPRKAVVILSDGGDNHSRISESELRAMVRESNVAIYAVGLFDSSHFMLPEEQHDGPRLLETLCRESGGRLFSPDRTADLPAIAAQIGTELRNRYVIGYAPASLPPLGKYRRVEVKVVPRERQPGLRVFWRQGYSVSLP